MNLAKLNPHLKYVVETIPVLSDDDKFNLVQKLKNMIIRCGEDPEAKNVEQTEFVELEKLGQYLKEKQLLTSPDITPVECAISRLEELQKDLAEAKENLSPTKPEEKGVAN